MNTKIGFLVIFSLICIMPVADAQISIGEKAEQKSVEVTINSVGDVHVKHVIDPSNLPKQVELIFGTVSNLSVTNKQGEEKLFSVIGGSNGILIQPSKENSIIEYDLDHVLTLKNDVWTWSFRYLETTSFVFPEELDLIFANERPIFLDDRKGILCHGCQMVLEYSINEPSVFKNVKWKDKEFIVEIRSHSTIDKFIFDQPTKRIVLGVSEGNRLVTTIIPLELLWEPYTVLYEDKKIDFHKYANNGTHVWLSMRPETSGDIVIIGTTAVPEFPIIAPLAVGFSIILVMPLIRKFNLH